MINSAVLIYLSCRPNMESYSSLRFLFGLLFAFTLISFYGIILSVGFTYKFQYFEDKRLLEFLKVKIFSIISKVSNPKAKKRESVF